MRHWADPIVPRTIRMSTISHCQHRVAQRVSTPRLSTPSFILTLPAKKFMINSSTGWTGPSQSQPLLAGIENLQRCHQTYIRKASLLYGVNDLKRCSFYLCPGCRFLWMCKCACNGRFSHLTVKQSHLMLFHDTVLTSIWLGILFYHHGTTPECGWSCQHKEARKAPWSHLL